MTKIQTIFFETSPCVTLIKAVNLRQLLTLLSSNYYMISKSPLQINFTEHLWPSTFKNSTRWKELIQGPHKTLSISCRFQLDI